MFDQRHEKYDDTGVAEIKPFDDVNSERHCRSLFTDERRCRFPGGLLSCETATEESRQRWALPLRPQRCSPRVNQLFRVIQMIRIFKIIFFCQGELRGNAGSLLRTGQRPRQFIADQMPDESGRTGQSSRCQYSESSRTGCSCTWFPIQFSIKKNSK